MWGRWTDKHFQQRGKQDQLEQSKANMVVGRHDILSCPSLVAEPSLVWEVGPRGDGFGVMTLMLEAKPKLSW